MKLAKSDVSRFVSLTGRVQSYIEDDKNGLMPVSCTMYKYFNDIYDYIKYLSVALRGGAGISVCMDDFIAREPQPDVNFFFYLPEDHPDYVDLSEEQLEKWKYINNITDSSNYYIIPVNDSMEEDDKYTHSIQKSWDIFIGALENGLIPVVDLSRIRPKNTANDKGLVASGATSFLTIYEAILNHINKGDLISLMQLGGQMNEILRRGGIFKNGIVTFSLHHSHPDIIRYLNVPLADIPGSGKKAIRLDTDVLENKRLMKLIEVRVNDKSLFMMKTCYVIDCPQLEPTGQLIYEIGVPLHEIEVKYFGLNYTIEELYSQVCVEVLMLPTATCLLLNVNYGQINTLDELETAYIEATKLGIDIWKSWKADVGDSSSQYLSADKDRQIGICPMGLANLLAHLNIAYGKFVRATEAFLDNGFYPTNLPEYQLVVAIDNAHMKAAALAREAGLERFLSIKPDQSNAYRGVDLKGNTTCKNINPPLQKRVRRTSHTVDTLAGVYYHGNVETIQSVIEENGVDIIQRLWEGWQRLMNRTGLAHCASFDLYREIDEPWLKDFITRSPLVTTYYMVADKVNQDYLNKSRANTATNDLPTGVCAIDNPGSCESCAE